MVRVANFVGRLLNVNKTEWSRISLSWFINFFYRAGFVIGWTIIVGMFVGRFGIQWLPILFVVNGVFTMLGSLFYSTFLDKVPKERIILMSVLLAVLFLAAAAFVGHANEILFFSLLLAAEAVFLVQLKINTNGFVETLFTPLESERTFPIIESAETIGGITAGLLVVSFSTIIEPTQFVFMWMAMLVMIAPCFLYYRKFIKRVNVLSLDDESEAKHHHVGLIDRAKEVFGQAKHVAFIKGLIFMVVLQWIFANLIEYQYTKAVTQNVAETVMNSGSGFEHALVHDLGALFIVFSISALLIQLFVGSRLITSLGIVGSMLVYPIVMLLSVFGLTVKFGYPTAVLAQTNQHMTHAIYLNSYHSTYYSVKEHFREHIREFLEGFVRPLGAILGTSLLIGVQYLFVGQDLTLVLNLVMMVVLAILFFVIYGMQSNYTKLACHTLLRADDKLDRVDAIGILSQRGHKNSLPVLRQVLHDPKESSYIKVKILEALGELRDYNALDDIMKSFDSKSVDIRLAAVNALLSYGAAHRFFGKHIFHEYRIIEALKKLYKGEKNHEIRSVIIHILSGLNPVGTFGFLLKLLDKTRGALKADVIIALGRFNDDHVIEYVSPYLKSKNPAERGVSMIALWRSHDYKDDVSHELSLLLGRKDQKSLVSALHVVGALKLKRYKKQCVKNLKSNNQNVKAEAALALAKMGYAESVEVIVDMLFDGKPKIVEKIRHALKKLPHKTAKSINQEVRQIVADRINKLLDETKTKSLRHLETKHLKYLKMLYSLVDEHEEVELIQELIYSKSYS